MELLANHANISNAAKLANSIPSGAFAKALCSLLNITEFNQDGKPLGTIGLAISGGVDSMALAVLCSNLKKSHQREGKHYHDGIRFFNGIEFKAFIVDHQVRSGSYKEAKAVSDVLANRDIPSEILKIKWPEGQDYSKAPNFESLARKYRYRLLGEACRDDGIQNLMLAHHADDQAETVLMRLIAGHQEGLIGIKEKAGIPECYGMHGVYESGGLHPESSSNISRDIAKPGPKPIKTERGGIQVLRPLLMFEKDRLIATCVQENMKWFEDPTNKDPTLTQRNKIRQLYDSNTMPAKFSKPILLGLSTVVRNRITVEDRLVDSLFTKSIVKDFDTGVGTVKVQFPTTEDIHEILEDPNLNRMSILAKLLRQILFLVSPWDQINLKTLHGVLIHIFHSTIEPNKSRPPPKSFTVAGVYLQPVTEDLKDGTSTKNSKNTQWFLSRQPCSKSSDLPELPISMAELNTWTPWQLYDGRYWIRIRYLDASRRIIIRPFQESDMKTFRSSLTSNYRTALRQVLKSSARGSIRWTLPALVAIDSDGKEQVIALPTVGIHFNHSNERALWEVRYKKVELPKVWGELNSSKDKKSPLNLTIKR